ncbi:hypothetical protein ABZV64_15430 [Streptomyces sp. NPDC004959]|uniref:hypothetical protein n=1 Tax=unclassified Streptomyces TaxID=2593676 RepID=UPI0033A83394
MRHRLAGTSTSALLAALCLAAPAAATASPPPAPGSLTLVERVADGPGGAARPEEWTVAARGPVEIEGIHGTTTVTGVEVPPGDYRLTEYGGHPGYTSTLWHCAGRTGPLPTGDGKVTVAAGDTVRCVVTNRPVARGTGSEAGPGSAAGVGSEAGAVAGTGAGLPGPGGSRAPGPASASTSASASAPAPSGRLAEAGDGVVPGAGLFLAVVSGVLCAVGLGFLLVRRRLRD